MKRLDKRDPLKIYKKIDICRTEGIIENDFPYHLDEYIPIKYETTTNRKSEEGFTIRYLKRKDLETFLKR